MDDAKLFEYKLQKTGELITKGLLKPGVSQDLIWMADRLARQLNGMTPKSGDTIMGYVQVPANLLPTAAPSGQTKYDNSFAGRVCTYMEQQSYVIDKGPGQVNIVYIEGCDADGTPNQDEPNQFNDRRLVIKFENGAPKIVGNWEATTEPGTYYTEWPMNPSGAARIKFGQYLNTWQVGLHGQSRPHRALIQVRPVTVYRDFNKDGLRVGDKEDTGLFGINQHGGYNYPYSNISDSGAGCQVGREMDGQEEFMDIVESDPRFKNDHGYCFHTTIIPGDKLPKK